MYERGMRVRLRDRRWEVESVRGAGTQTLLELRRADDRPGPRRLTVLPELEPTLQPEPARALRFELGNPVRLNQLHDALALTMAHGRVVHRLPQEQPQAGRYAPGRNKCP